MQVDNQPRENRYDVVVVGSGLGGVSAAALLANAGKKVLVVERQEGPGGYAHAFRDGPYTFDPAIHVTVQGGRGQVLDRMLDFLGVRDRCNFHRFPGIYATRFPDFEWRAPDGREAFTEALVDQFPDEAVGLRRFVGLCNQLYDDAHEFSARLTLEELERAVTDFPVFFKYRRATVEEVLNECVRDPRARAVSTAMWPYFGLPPSRLGFLTFAQNLSGFLGGCYGIEGGVQKLVDAFVTALHKHGGELVVSNRVRRILVEGGRVRGVVLADGRQVRAPIVVSNADGRQTFEELVGLEYLPAIQGRRLRTLMPSFSAFVIYSATALDLHALQPAPETFLHKHWDFDVVHDDITHGRPGGMWVSLPTLHDPSLMPPGESSVVLTCLAPYDVGSPWTEARERYLESLLGDIEAMFPGFRSKLTYLSTATPLTLERYTASYRGAAYGWESTPQQTGTKRLTSQTPIGGLYLSSHWSQQSGSFRVIVGGMQVAKMIMQKEGEPEAVPNIFPVDLP